MTADVGLSTTPRLVTLSAGGSEVGLINLFMSSTAVPMTNGISSRIIWLPTRPEDLEYFAQGNKEED